MGEYPGQTSYGTGMIADDTDCALGFWIDVNLSGRESEGVVYT